MSQNQASHPIIKGFYNRITIAGVVAVALTFVSGVALADSNPDSSNNSPVTGFRADMSIAVIMCGPVSPSLTHKGLNNVVALLNNQVAPWYSWQSSGLFNLTFTPGGVITLPTDYWYSDQVYNSGVRYNLPKACSDKASGLAGGGPKTYIISKLPNTPAGWALLGGGTSVTYYDPSVDLESTSLEASFLDTIGHELDHAILGLPHIRDDPNTTNRCGFSGPTRYFEGRDLSQSDSTFFGEPSPIPNELPLSRTEFDLDKVRYHSNFFQRFTLLGSAVHEDSDVSLRGVLSCDQRRALGWPVGADLPLCLDHLAPAELDLSQLLDITSAGDVIVNTPFNTSNISGYILAISELREFTEEQREWTVSDRNDLWQGTLFRGQDMRTLEYNDNDDYANDTSRGASDIRLKRQVQAWQELVGETLCSRMSCITQAMVDFRITPASPAQYCYNGKCPFFITTLHALDMNDFPYTLHGLIPGRTYRISIATYSPGGTSQFSPYVEVQS